MLWSWALFEHGQTTHAKWSEDGHRVEICQTKLCLAAKVPYLTGAISGVSLLYNCYLEGARCCALGIVLGEPQNL